MDKIDIHDFRYLSKCVFFMKKETHTLMPMETCMCRINCVVNVKGILYM